MLPVRAPVFHIIMANMFYVQMNDFPGAGDYSPRDKYLSTTARLSAVPIFHDGEERFLDDKARKYVPAPNAYGGGAPKAPKAVGGALALDKQSEERFKMDKDKVALPSPANYEIPIKKPMTGTADMSR